MTTQRKAVTAGELLAQRNADPAWVEMRARQDAAHAALADELGRAEAPLVADLAAAGYPVESVWDLVNRAGTYPRAVPVLLEHLERPYPPQIRAGIARALGVPETKAAGWRLITRLFRDEKERQVKDWLAVAISRAADDEVLDDVIALARDTRQGSSRLLLLRALERSREPRARAALMELGIDPDLAKEIQVILIRAKKKTRR